MSEFAESQSPFKAQGLEIKFQSRVSQFEVLALDIAEAASTSYSISAEISTTDLSILCEDLISESFTFTISESFNEHHFSGICVEASIVEVDKKRKLFAVRVCSWLWNLAQNVRCEIFQDLSCTDIAQKIISRYSGGEVRLNLVDRYDPIPYTVQYFETDLNYLFRILAARGVYFYMEQGEDSQTMVLCDGPGSHGSQHRPLPFQYFPPEKWRQRESQHIFEFDTTQYVVHGAVEVNDYNFEQIEGDLRHQSRTYVNNTRKDDLVLYTPQFGHKELGQGEQMAKVFGQAIDASQTLFTGACNIVNLSVGTIFSFSGHPADEFNHRDYLVTATQKSISSDVGDGSNPSYVCRLEAIPADKTYRPPRVQNRPNIAGYQTAVVTGPAGEEIFTDPDGFGRVKVWFHWDKKENKNENSSCWIRVATQWAGKGWGSCVIPRVGQEVLVHFENGDPDRPIIVGMVYNAQNPPPYDLPAGASQSGFKSNTTKGGGGANEIRMEDKKDGQELAITAEKDYTLTAKNDATISVGFEKAAPGSMVQKVKQDLTSEVESGNHSFHVKAGTSTVTIASGRTETIEAGGDALDVTGERSVNASEAYRVTTPAATVHAENTAEIESQEVTVNGTVKTVIGENEIEVTGTTVKVTGMTSIELVCGPSSIKLDASGVTVMGPMVKLN